MFTCNGISSLQPTKLLKPLLVNVLNQTYSYNGLPEDEPSGSKHVEDILKIKMALLQRCVLLVYITPLLLLCRENNIFLLSGAR